MVLSELRVVVPNARNVNLKASRPLPTPSLPAQRSWGRSEDLASTRLLLQGSICGRHPSHLGGNRSFRPRTHTSPRHDPSEALTRAGPGALSVLLAGALWATPRGLPAPGGCQKGRTEKSRPAAYQRPSRHPSALNPFRDICQQNTSNLGGAEQDNVVLHSCVGVKAVKQGAGEGGG